jgi:hypothetical protein
MFFEQAYEEKSVLQDSWPLLLQWEVNFHKSSEDELSKCFRDKLPLRYNYTVLQEAKALIEPTFGIGILNYYYFWNG